jgi:hypothetical protein
MGSIYRQHHPEISQAFFSTTPGAEEPLTRDEVPGPGNILDKTLPSPPRGAPGQRSLT